uniref:Uncharacterized protein n=1 Tax=Gouania willdenowi TaxID=441366 RepID=A0A8C5G0T5_GOUWI
MLRSSFRPGTSSCKSTHLLLMCPHTLILVRFLNVLRESRGKMFCTVCNIAVEHKQKSLLDFSTSKHASKNGDNKQDTKPLFIPISFLNHINPLYQTSSILSIMDFTFILIFYPLPRPFSFYHEHFRSSDSLRFRELPSVMMAA